MANNNRILCTDTAKYGGNICGQSGQVISLGRVIGSAVAAKVHRNCSVSRSGEGL
jgi:hypothetical protein